MGISGDPKDDRITHGICPECMAKQLKELDRLKVEREVKT